MSRAILDDTKMEAERIVRDARLASERAMERAREEAEEIRAQMLKRARSEAEHLEQRTEATARLEAQRIVLTARERAIDAAFERACELLAAKVEKEGYAGILEDLVLDAVPKLGPPETCVVRVSAQDQSILEDIDLDELASAWRGRVNLIAGQPVEINGGVIVETVDGHRRYDNSFQARLKRERPRLRAQVYRLLQGAT